MECSYWVKKIGELSVCLCVCLPIIYLSMHCEILFSLQKEVNIVNYESMEGSRECDAKTVRQTLDSLTTVRNISQAGRESGITVSIARSLQPLS